MLAVVLPLLLLILPLPLLPLLVAVVALLWLPLLVVMLLEAQAVLGWALFSSWSRATTPGQWSSAYAAADRSHLLLLVVPLLLLLESRQSLRRTAQPTRVPPGESAKRRQLKNETEEKAQDYRQGLTGGERVSK